MSILFASLWQASLSGAVVVVVLRIDLPHRRLARPLLVRVRNQAGQARNEKDGVPELVRKTQIGADRRDRAVDIDRQRSSELLLLRVERSFARANQPYVLAL